MPVASANRPVVLAAVIMAAVFVCYCRVLWAGWIWDDDFYVWNNPTLRSLAGLRDIWLVPKATPQYYPLVHTSYWLEYRLWGDAPAGYHLVNLLLHAGSCLLLWRLLAALAVPGGWLAGLLAAIHPVEVESVAWVTERKNTLSMLLALAALNAWQQFRFSTDASRHRWRWYGVSIACFLAALLAKTVTITLVGVLPLLTWWKTGRLTRRDLALTAPFLLAGLPLAIGTVLLEKYHVGASGTEWQLAGAERLLVAGRAIWFYFSKLLWPEPLIFFYRRWVLDVTSPAQWAFPLAGLAVLAGLFLLRGRIGRGPFTVAACFCGCLFPALGFFDVYPFKFSFVADHFQYHASAAILAGVAATVTVLWQRLPRWRVSLQVATAAACCLLAAQTMRQTGAYHDLETLGRDTLAKNPDAWAMRDILGPYLTTTGRAGEAEAVYQPVLAGTAAAPPWPHDQAQLFYNLARAVEAQGRFAEAEGFYRQAISRDPEYPKPRNNLAKLLADTGRRRESVVAYRALLNLPLTAADQSRYAFNLGTVLAELGDWQAAEQTLQWGLQRNPQSAAIHEWLGIVATQQNQKEAAIGWFRRGVAVADEPAVRQRIAAHLRRLEQSHPRSQ